MAVAWSAATGTLPVAAQDDDEHADRAAEHALAEAYAPVVMVRAQTERCGDGEPFVPIAVGALWDRDDVVLRGPDGAVVVGPDADDLAGKGDGWHLDLPGNALRPGCAYERFADELDGVPTVYARILPADGGGLALQYWFFYVYNDWNDRHEGDWEMIQLSFDVADPGAALLTAPRVVAYAQHEGAELADWGGDTVQVVNGTHPLVFPGEGSPRRTSEPTNGSARALRAASDATTRAHHTPRSALRSCCSTAGRRPHGSTSPDAGASGSRRSTTDRQARTPRPSGTRHARGSTTRVAPVRWHCPPAARRSPMPSVASPSGHRA
ncbi:MAG: hypothetical protein R2713_01950 [Ilumatobacteraceae bacterium]